jgi:hypothetical protein
LAYKDPDFQITDEKGDFISGLIWKMEFLVQYACLLISIYCLWFGKFDVLAILNDLLEQKKVLRNLGINLRISAKFYWIFLIVTLTDFLFFVALVYNSVESYLEKKIIEFIFEWIPYIIFFFIGFLQSLKSFYFLYASQLFKALHSRLLYLIHKNEKFNFVDLLETNRKTFDFVAKVDSFLKHQTSLFLLSSLLSIAEAVILIADFDIGLLNLFFLVIQSVRNYDIPTSWSEHVRHKFYLHILLLEQNDACNYVNQKCLS